MIHYSLKEARLLSCIYAVPEETNTSKQNSRTHSSPPPLSPLPLTFYLLSLILLPISPLPLPSHSFPLTSPPHTPPFYKIVSEAKIQPHSTPAEGVALVGWPSGLAPGRRCVPGVPMSPPSVPLACPPPLSVPLHIRGCSSLSTPRRLLQFS